MFGRLSAPETQATNASWTSALVGHFTAGDDTPSDTGASPPDLLGPIAVTTGSLVCSLCQEFQQTLPGRDGQLGDKTRLAFCPNRPSSL